MTEPNNGMSCQTSCWGLAGLIGLLTAILLLALGGYSWGASIFLGLVAFVLLGFLFTWLFCSPVPKAGDTAGSGTGVAAAVAGGGAAVAAGAATAASAAKGAASSGADAAKTAAASAKDTAADAASGAKDAAANAASSAKDAATSAAGTAKDAASSAADTAKGAAASAADAAGSAKEAAADAGGAVVSKSKELSGEAELAERKGSWKYEGDGEAEKAKKPAKAKAKAAPKKAKAKAAPAKEAPKAADIGEDYDGDGVLEGTDEGSKPETLTAARAGGADNLKEIKGVGPKLEKMLNEMGFYHFDQVANWTAAEVAWVNANLSGFKGRVSRDNWVAQAKILAAGGETEFSKRVDKGGVY